MSMLSFLYDWRIIRAEEYRSLRSACSLAADQCSACKGVGFLFIPGGTVRCDKCLPFHHAIKIFKPVFRTLSNSFYEKLQRLFVND